MKTIFITYDRALHDLVIEALDASNARGYTLLSDVSGRGTKTGDPHLGSHAWPTLNDALFTIVEDSQTDPLLKRLRQLDIDNPLLGLRAFVWNVEQSI
ncbi:MAG: hypothetical protein II806_05560 [Bacteroidaceae bacterium]|nr:hypothetical protein [Bacteroidaceae bacterium]MBP5523129.1 hypothetical protein [Bacteroidaceae bacterium]MBQ4380728.1 hypothetical protein [Bacteroidaceae bacterium]